MNEKELYICLIASLCQPGETPEYRFMTASIASSEEEAKQIAINEARLDVFVDLQLAIISPRYNSASGPMPVLTGRAFNAERFKSYA